MEEGYYLIYKCPKCGQTSFREDYSHMDICGFANSYNVKWFSDGKVTGLSVSESPKVVKCKKCKTFYWLDDANETSECFGEDDVW
jgi:phage FluMu protein Com